MKFPVHRVVAALLLFVLPLSCLAQIRIYLPVLPFKPMALAPGLYASGGEAAMWESEPHEIAARIERVDGNRFSGELELVCLDRNGSFVRLRSRMTGTIGSAGITTEPGKIVVSPTAPLTLQLQDEPLRSVMPGVTANMQADGFRLSWESPRGQMGNDSADPGGALAAATAGRYETLIVTSEDAYGQMLDRYQEMASDKTQLMADQASSADSLKKSLATYMQETDALLRTPVDDDQSKAIFAKATALYKRERALLDGHPPSEREAEWIAMQIAAYQSRMVYILRRQDEAVRDWQGKGQSVLELVSHSPCISRTSPSRLRQGVSPACDGLATAYDAVTKRIFELSKALDYPGSSKDSMECLWEAARHALKPDVEIPSPCRQVLANL